MRKLKMFLVIFFLSGMFFTAIGQYAKIEGVLLYDNDASKPMNNVTIRLEDSSGDSLGTIDTDYDASFGDGYYWFNIPTTGTYYVYVIDNGQNYGGWNATDAMMINQHILGSITLSGIYLEAADVNYKYGNGSINPTWL